MSNKPRKKNNSVVRDRKMASIFTKSLAITQLPNEYSEIIDIDTLTVCKRITPHRIRDLTGHQHKWTVLLCVFGRTEDGKEYFKSEEVTAPRICYQNEIGDSMNALHNKMYEAFNKNHFVSLGWIASPHDREFNLDDMQKLFTDLGAWEYLNKDENKRNIHPNSVGLSDS